MNHLAQDLTPPGQSLHAQQQSNHTFLQKKPIHRANPVCHNIEIFSISTSFKMFDLEWLHMDSFIYSKRHHKATHGPSLRRDEQSLLVVQVELCWYKPFPRWFGFIHTDPCPASGTKIWPLPIDLFDHRLFQLLLEHRNTQCHGKEPTHWVCSFALYPDNSHVNVLSTLNNNNN